MPFESRWSSIPLAARWAVSLLICAAFIVALVLFVNHNSGGGEVPVSAKKMKLEAAQAQIVIGQEQAPIGVRIAPGARVTTVLAAAVRRDLNHQIYEATIDGPLQTVRCVIHGGTFVHTGYHCLAKVADVQYPFLAVVTPGAHHAWFCEKIYPPSPSENIPVSGRCIP